MGPPLKVWLGGLGGNSPGHQWVEHLIVRVRPAGAHDAGESHEGRPKVSWMVWKVYGKSHENPMDDLMVYGKSRKIHENDIWMIWGGTDGYSVALFSRNLHGKDLGILCCSLETSQHDLQILAERVYGLPSLIQPWWGPSYGIAKLLQEKEICKEPL